MFRSSKVRSGKTGKMYTLVLLTTMPLLTGCDPYSAGVLTFGTALWTDIFFTPIRSALGALTISIINSI